MLMRRFQDARTKKQRMVYHGWRRALYSWPALVVFICLVILLFRGLLNVYSRFDQSRRERAAVTEELATLEARKAKLEKKIELLSSPEGQEEEIRRNYQVGAPGEGVIVILGTTTRD